MWELVDEINEQEKSEDQKNNELLDEVFGLGSTIAAVGQEVIRISVIAVVVGV